MTRKLLLLFIIFVVSSKVALNLSHHIGYFVHHWHRFKGLLLGVSLFSLLWYGSTYLPLLKNWLIYYGVKNHENAHEKMAFLSGRRLFGYKVNHDGTGYIEYEYTGVESPFITLAPYFFSYVSLILLVIRFFVFKSLLLYFDLLLGFSLAFHTYCYITQTRFYQTDLIKIGKFYSILFISLMHLLFYGLYIHIIGGLSLKNYFF